jgi:uncharacterized repeat protein (TIGR03803 family)
MRVFLAVTLVLPAFGASAGVVLTSLHSFQVFTNGGGPSAGLVQGSDGNFYGTTDSGGTNGGHGTVFRISATGALTTLYSFIGGKDGGRLQNQRHRGADHFVSIWGALSPQPEPRSPSQTPSRTARNAFTGWYSCRS